MDQSYKGKFLREPSPEPEQVVIPEAMDALPVQPADTEEPVQPPVIEESVPFTDKENAPLEKKEPWQKSLFRDARDILYVLAIFMLVYTMFFRTVVVIGDSMYDTLVDGDRLLLISNFIYHNPKQGDIIVASKDSFHNGEGIIKRVIATEGQEVDIDFHTGTVYVDGVALEEDYIYSPTLLEEGVVFPVTVEKGCVFVMGDNRMDSKDSRSPAIGMIDCREILGKAVFLMLPGDDGGTEKRDFGRIGVIG